MVTAFENRGYYSVFKAYHVTYRRVASRGEAEIAATAPLLIDRFSTMRRQRQR